MMMKTATLKQASLPRDDRNTGSRCAALLVTCPHRTAKKDVYRHAKSGVSRHDLKKERVDTHTGMPTLKKEEEKSV